MTTRTLSSWPSWYQGMCMPVPILHVFVEPMNPSFYALVTATPHCTPLQHRIQSGAPIGGAQALWHTLTSSSGTARWIHWNNRILSESPLCAPYEAGLSCSARALMCDRMRAVWSGKALPAMDLLSGNTNYFTYWKLRVAWWLAKTFCFEAGFAKQPKCFVGRTKRGFRAIYSRLYHPH